GWEGARQDLLVHLPVRRLERSLLLVLQLLTAAVVVLALARRQVVLPAAGGLATVLVMDTSASMQATDVAPSRFEAARAAAVAEVARGAGPVMVVDAGPQPHAVTGFVDHGTARAVLLRLHPTDGPARLEQAVTMAVAQGGGACGRDGGRAGARCRRRGHPAGTHHTARSARGRRHGLRRHRLSAAARACCR